jgi:hypothetical protein
MKKILIVILTLTMLFGLIGCADPSAYVAYGSEGDTDNAVDVANKLQRNQPTPTDIDYSLERYNLIKRAYWVNGMREKANTLPCPVDKPLGYIVLFTESGAVVGSFIVDGKVSSLNSFLTPDSKWYEQGYWSEGGSKDGANEWLADVDGSYGTNDNGIFFFTPDGKYIEWSGTYLYSDIPFIVDDPVIRVGE